MLEVDNIIANVEGQLNSHLWTDVFFSRSADSELANLYVILIILFLKYDFNLI